MKIKLKKGDMVIVRSGKFKGRTAKITAVQPARNSVTLEGVNVVTRHRRPTSQNPQAASYELTRSLPVSKVAYYDAGAKKGTRLGYKLSKDAKVRVMKRSGKEIK